MSPKGDARCVAFMEDLSDGEGRRLCEKEREEYFMGEAGLDRFAWRGFVVARVSCTAIAPVLGLEPIGRCRERCGRRRDFGPMSGDGVARLGPGSNCRT